MTTILNQNILEIIYEYLDNEIELITNIQNTKIVSVIYNCKMCDRLVGYPEDLINSYCIICYYNNIFFHLNEELVYLVKKNTFMISYVEFHNNCGKLYPDITFGQIIQKYLKLKASFNKYIIAENIDKLGYIIDELKIIRNILLITFVNN